VILVSDDIIVHVVAVIMNWFASSEEVRSGTCVFYMIWTTFCTVDKQV
jgi:hypothetical protein